MYGLTLLMSQQLPTELDIMTPKNDSPKRPKYHCTIARVHSSEQVNKSFTTDNFV